LGREELRSRCGVRDRVASGLAPDGVCAGRRGSDARLGEDEVDGCREIVDDCSRLLLR
jgi:hypothetical protein